MPKISIIIPCYFNEHNIPVTFSVLLETEKNFPSDVQFEYIFVDDGSKDGTFQALTKVYEKHPEKVKVIKLTRNFGAGNAAYCGITHSTGNCCIVLSADLQDPPELIPQMYQHWLKGYKLVLAQKANREDSFITKLFSNTYHYLIQHYVLTNAPKGGFDLWLFDEQVRTELIKMNEKNFYLPYFFIWMGYDYVSIPYTRRKREIGKSKWTLSKKIKAFFVSFVSLTYLPLRFFSIIGILLGLLALIYAGIIIYAKFTFKIPIQGWSSIMIIVLFTSSFVMISLGIIGEYLYRTLDAVRNRPNFIIDKIYDIKK